VRGRRPRGTSDLQSALAAKFILFEWAVCLVQAVLRIACWISLWPFGSRERTCFACHTLDSHCAGVQAGRAMCGRT